LDKKEIALQHHQALKIQDTDFLRTQNTRVSTLQLMVMNHLQNLSLRSLTIFDLIHRDLLRISMTMVKLKKKQEPSSSLTLNLIGAQVFKME